MCWHGIITYLYHSFFELNFFSFCTCTLSWVYSVSSEFQQGKYKISWMQTFPCVWLKRVIIYWFRFWMYLQMFLQIAWQKCFLSFYMSLYPEADGQIRWSWRSFPVMVYHVILWRSQICQQFVDSCFPKVYNYSSCILYPVPPIIVMTFVTVWKSCFLHF